VPYYFLPAVPRFVLRAQHRTPLTSARALRAELLSGQCCLRNFTRVAPLWAKFLSECGDTNYLHLYERRKRSPRWFCDERTPVRATVAGVGAIRPAGRCILPNIQYRIGQQASCHFIVPFYRSVYRIIGNVSKTVCLFNVLILSVLKCVFRCGIYRSVIVPFIVPSTLDGLRISILQITLSECTPKVPAQRSPLVTPLCSIYRIIYCIIHRIY
jgi:hypothetical protein